MLASQSVASLKTYFANRASIHLTGTECNSDADHFFYAIDKIDGLVSPSPWDNSIASGRDTSCVGIYPAKLSPCWHKLQYGHQVSSGFLLPLDFRSHSFLGRSLHLYGLLVRFLKLVREDVNADRFALLVLDD
ncbi:MAG TPA: hypothetical protein VGZ29_07575 [Terriglobia bacterium]|nr:hypothetical protein [Terriglobia bacterium]